MSDNITKIKYIQVLDKLYEVTDISFYYMTMTAIETDLTCMELPEDEVFNVMEFQEYKITLKNLGGRIIDMREWEGKHHLSLL